MLRYDAAARSSEPNTTAVPSCGQRRHNRRGPIPGMTVLRRKPSARFLRMKSNVTALNQYLKEVSMLASIQAIAARLLQSDDPKLALLLDQRIRRADDRTRAMAGAQPRQGEFPSSPLWPIERSMPDLRPG